MMKFIIITIFILNLLSQSVWPAAIDKSSKTGEQSVHFGFHTENGQYRTEDITFNNTNDINDKDNDVVKPVEYRGGYSFISADGYEYMVLYKANKNGFQPYVTAHKIKPSN